MAGRSQDVLTKVSTEGILVPMERNPMVCAICKLTPIIY